MGTQAESWQASRKRRAGCPVKSGFAPAAAQHLDHSPAHPSRLNLMLGEVQNIAKARQMVSELELELKPPE